MVADSSASTPGPVCPKCSRIIITGEVFRAAPFNPTLLEHVDCSKGPEVENDERE